MIVVLEPESLLMEDFIQYTVGSVLIDNIEVTLFLDKEDAVRVIGRCVELLLSIYVKPYMISSFSGTKITWLSEEDLRKTVHDVVSEVLSDWYSNEIVNGLRNVLRMIVAWGGGR